MNECGERLGGAVTEIAYGFEMLSPATNAAGTAGFNWKSIQRRLIKLQLGALVRGFRPLQETTGNRSTQFPSPTLITKALFESFVRARLAVILIVFFSTQILFIWGGHVVFSAGLVFAYRGIKEKASLDRSDSLVNIN
jgi:hypothetical protein